jgi:putative transposase
MKRTYAYRLYPNKRQERLLAQTVETCRRVYNNALAERKEAWEEEQRSVSMYEQLRQLKTLRKENHFAGAVSSHTLQVVIADVDKAFKAFFRRVKKGEKPGYPRFKGRNRFDSFGFKQYGNGIKLDGKRLRIFGVGRVRIRMHRPIPENGVIKTARIKRKAGKWYVMFVVDIPTPEPLPETGRAVGIDVGIHHMLATSDGDTIENPRWYRKAEAQLRRKQRKFARRKKGSNRRRKAVRELQTEHVRIANRRTDYIKKLVHGLVSDYDVIAIEDLRITNMVRNKHLSKSIMDAGWGYFKLHLIGKAEEAGREVIKVNPAYTSRTCSACGHKFDSMPLSRRWIVCPSCGQSIDRDVNAAQNILHRAGHARRALTWPEVGASVAREPSRVPT